jgi:hypothetical protein
MRFLKQSTAVDLGIGPFVDSTDGVTAETALTLTQPDIRLKKNGGAWAQKNASQTLSHEENGWYEVSLDTTDTNTLGVLLLNVSESGALPVFCEFMVLPANVYDSLVGGSDVLDVSTTQFNGSAVTQSGGRPEVNVTHAAGTAWNSGGIGAATLASDTITAAKIAADAIGASEIAADAIIEMRSLASGTSDSGTTTTMVDAARTEADTDYWVGQMIVFTSGNIAGQARLITAFNASTDTITFTPATTQAVGTQTYEIWPNSRKDVSHFGGTAGTFSSGRPEVNTTHAAGTAWGSGAITAASIASNAITSAKIAADAIGSSQIADNAIDAGAIATGAITSAKFAAGAITATVIATDAIDADALATDAVTEIWNAGTRTLTSLGTGSGLTAIPWNSAWDAEVQSEAQDAITASGLLDAAGVRTAVGLGSANLDTQLSTIDTVVDAILVDTGTTLDGAISTIDGIVDAIKVTTDKLDDTLEDDAGTYRFTENALEEAPSGTGASAASIADAVWDELLSGHAISGSAGEALTDAAAGGGGGLDAAGVRAALGFASASYDTDIAGINTNINANETKIDTVDTVLDALVADVGSNGAGLTALPWNASWDAEVQSEVTDALNAYDPPTRAELTSDIDSIPTAAENAAAVWGAGARTLTGIDEDSTTLDLDATIRAAVGLASANLDTQIDALPTAAEAATAVWGAGTRSLTIIDEDSTTLDLDATIRGAVGMSSANLDTQIGDLPTNSELTAALAAADDAVLAAISALSIPTANANADALLDRAAGIETGLTVRQGLRLISAALLGKASGLATTSATYRDVGDTKNRIVATVDGDGNRSAVTLDAT